MNSTILKWIFILHGWWVYYISFPNADSGGIYSTKLYWVYIMGIEDTAEDKAQC